MKHSRFNYSKHHQNETSNEVLRSPNAHTIVVNTIILYQVTTIASNIVDRSLWSAASFSCSTASLFGKPDFTVLSFQRISL